MRRECLHTDVRGFSLLELVVALLVFQLGLLAVAGLALTGQRIMRASGLVLRATVEAHALGDSLLLEGVAEEGEREAEWGWLRWEPGSTSGPGLRVLALSPARDDTLALLRLWPTPGPGVGERALPEEEP